MEGDGTPSSNSQNFAQGENLVPRHTGCGVSGNRNTSGAPGDAASTAVLLVKSMREIQQLESDLEAFHNLPAITIWTRLYL